MLSVFAMTARTQQNISDNQNKTNMESNTIKPTIEGGRTFTITLSSIMILIHGVSPVWER